MTDRGFMKIGYGDLSRYSEDLAQWESNQKVLEENYENYGLPSKLEELDEEQLDILRDIISHTPSSSSGQGDIKVTSTKPKEVVFEETLFINLITEECPITTKNFHHLLIGDKVSKTSGKPLHYKGVRIHRLVKDFIIQGGDITKNNGMGGESIYGPKFNDEKNGLTKFKFQFGTVGMSSGSSKNSNSSQFFICLVPPISPADSKEIQQQKQKQLNKLNGKYVIFGQVTDKTSLKLLGKLNTLDTDDNEEISQYCWIDDCGMCQ